jgi:hypothetical protein
MAFVGSFPHNLNHPNLNSYTQSQVHLFGDDAYMVSSIISNRETIGKPESSCRDVGGSLMPMLNVITLLNNPSL